MVNEMDWKQYYSVIGEFVVDFENIVFSIRDGCISLVESRGLRDQLIGEIIFGQKYLTAEPLISCYMTMTNHIIRYTNGKQEITKRLDEFKKKFGKLIEVRNEIIHGTHFLVESKNIVGPDKVEREFKAYKASIKKTGYDVKKTPMSQVIQNSQELKELFTEFKKLNSDLLKFLIDNELTTRDYVQRT